MGAEEKKHETTREPQPREGEGQPLPTEQQTRKNERTSATARGQHKIKDCILYYTRGAPGVLEPKRRRKGDPCQKSRQPIKNKLTASQKKRRPLSKESSAHQKSVSTSQRSQPLSKKSSAHQSSRQPQKKRPISKSRRPIKDGSAFK